MPENPKEKDTYFAPAEREPIEKIREEFELVANQPLLTELLNSMINIVLVLNKHRQIVFANNNVLALVGTDDLTKALGLRPGEALNCIRSGICKGGCGTSEYCSQCGAVKAILEAIDGREAVKECQVNRLVHGRVEALDLRVKSKPFVLKGETYVLLSIIDIGDEKRRQTFEESILGDVSSRYNRIEAQSEEIYEHLPPGRPMRKMDMMMRTVGEFFESLQAQHDLMVAESHKLRTQKWPQFTRELLHTAAKRFEATCLLFESKINIPLNSLNEEVYTDPVLLQRVMGYLITNALEASKPGDIVTLSCKRNGKNIEIHIHNREVMPKEVTLQVFNRSFSTKSPRRGLGTYSAKMLTERYLNGTVSFTSKSPEGTTFILSLPAHARVIP